MRSEPDSWFPTRTATQKRQEIKKRVNDACERIMEHLYDSIDDEATEIITDLENCLDYEITISQKTRLRKASTTPRKKKATRK